MIRVGRSLVAEERQLVKDIVSGSVDPDVMTECNNEKGCSDLF